MKQISIESIVSRSWDLAVTHWPVFILLVIVNSLVGGCGVNYDSSVLTNMGQNPDPQVVAQALRESLTVSPWLIVGVLVSLYLGFITYRMLRNAIVMGRPYDNLGEVLKVDLTQFAIFFAVDVCYGVAVGAGTLLCIIPGIILAVRLMFAPVIAATEDVTFSQAFSRSWDMTRGHFWSLFLLGLAAVGIYIVGFLCCCVGVIFAEVIVNFMLMVAYLDLKDDDEADYIPFEEEYTVVEEPVATPGPAAADEAETTIADNTKPAPADTPEPTDIPE